MAENRDPMIKSSLEDTPIVDRSINRRLAEEFAKTVETHEDGYEVTVSSVERDSRSGITRHLGAIAAALAVIIGMGGGAVLISRTMSPADELPDQSITDTEEMTTELPTSPEPTTEFDRSAYGMETKEDIYFKMVNSILFFDKVSGSYTSVTYSESDGTCFTVDDFCVDLIANKSFSQVVDYNTYSGWEDVINGNAEYIAKKKIGGDESIFNDGYIFGLYNTSDNMYWMVVDARQYMSYLDPLDDEEEDPQEIYDTRRNWSAVSVEDARDYHEHYDERTLYGTQNENNPFDGGDHISGIRDWLISGVLHPINEAAEFNYDIGVRGFSNFDNWEIVGDTEFAGRECVQIHFDNNENAAADLIVDKATGCLLKKVAYYGGKFWGAEMITEIHFDDDAKPVPDIDLNEYEDLTEKAVALKEEDRKLNSTEYDE